MLRINQQTNALAAKSYHSSAAEYHRAGGEQEIVGQWGGEAADRLNLTGNIQHEHFSRLCDNRDPFTEEQLTARMRKDRRVGYDFTFDASKSVSILYGITDDPAILEAFRWAIRATMEEMEAGVKARVRKRGQFDERVVGNMAWAEFIHFTARPVNGVIDPHLHAHAFVPNVCWDHVEHAWKAIDVASIKEGAPHWQAMVNQRFGERLGQLGYPVAWKGDGFEIAGIDRDMIERFSHRTGLINRVAQERDITDAREKNQLGARTRERKLKTAAMPQLRKQWEQRLTARDRAALAVATVRRGFMAKTPLPYDGMGRNRDHAGTSRHAIRRVDAASLPPGLADRQTDPQRRQRLLDDQVDYHHTAAGGSYPAPMPSLPTPRPGHGR